MKTGYSVKEVGFISIVAIVLANVAAADAGIVERGAELFRRHCVACHGEGATSGASGDIRGISLATVRYAVRGGGQMPPIDLREDEIRAIAAWLAAIDQ